MALFVSVITLPLIDANVYSFQVPAIQKTNCDQHYGSCNNTVLSREAYQEISQGSCDQPQLLPDDLTACEPTVVELSFSDDLDALFTNTSIQSNAYDDAH